MTDQQKYRIECPQCSKGYHVLGAQLGRKLKCAKCETVFQTEALPPQTLNPSPSNPNSAFHPSDIPSPAAPMASNPFPAQIPQQTNLQQPNLQQPSVSQPSQGLGTDNASGFPNNVNFPPMAQPQPNQQPSNPYGAQNLTIQPVQTTGQTRCPDCHEMVPTDQLSFHRQQHLGTASDGQQNHYPTLPPEERYSGSLQGVPQHYLHTACGTVTTMPEDIIRTYLVNPFFYGYSSFCCGCNKHVSAKELTWTETKQSMMEYYRQLQQPFGAFCKERIGVITTLGLAGVAVGFFFALLIFFAVWVFASLSTGLLVGGIVFVIISIISTLILLGMRGGI